VGSSWSTAVKDLGGLVDTSEPRLWIAAGIVLGGVPALLISIFLLLASRALRRLTGHDASEGFGVVFTGATGILAAFALLLVDDLAAPPLFAVAIASGLTLLVVVLVDGSRARFLRGVYAGQNGEFDIVPRGRFAGDVTLAPMVANAASASVLVRVDQKIGSYRAAAARPIALLAATERETLQPLARRRIAATAMFLTMVLLAVLSSVTHPA
jgi:hypothetical protein